MPTEGLKVTSITLAVKTYRAETIRQHILTTGNAVIKSRFPKSRKRREAIPSRRTEEATERNHRFRASGWLRLQVGCVCVDQSTRWQVANSRQRHRIGTPREDMTFPPHPQTEAP
jgi:hypothetical protein